MATTIYTLYTCDAWKTYSSLRTYWIGTSFSKLVSAIKHGIADKSFDFTDDDDSRKAQLDAMKHYMECCDERISNDERASFISHHMRYGHISINTNNSFC